MYPTAQDVLTFAGKAPGEGQDLTVVTEHLNAATMMVRAYVRGNGFDADGPAEDLAAVIVSCAARLHANPTLDIQTSIGVDDGSWNKSPGIFKGWSLPELAVLHRYRVRAR